MTNLYTNSTTQKLTLVKPHIDNPSHVHSEFYTLLLMTKHPGRKEITAVIVHYLAKV